MLKEFIMSKEEIQKKIYELKTDEEISVFVEERINYLENQSVERTVGQNYTDSFQDYISAKMHFKPVEKIKGEDCTDLVYDDLQPYINLIKTIKNSKNNYSELTAFSDIFFTVHDYLPSNNFDLGRFFLYVQSKGKRLSIKTVAQDGSALCSERAGLAHNLFKFLGMDSEWISGLRDKYFHAYNMIYPNGYGTEPMVLYDPSFHINFEKEERKFSFGFFKAFKKEEYLRFISGEPIVIDLSSTERKYRSMYGDFLNDYLFTSDDLTPTYLFGLEASTKYKENIESMPSSQK